MQNVVLIIHLILAFALIVVVLLQRSEGGGLGMGGGGGGGGIMTGRQAANALTRLTWIFAVAFIITSVGLTVLAAQRAGGSSVIDRLGSGAAPVSPTAPAPGLPVDNLLPPPPAPPASGAADAPATPPRAN